MYIREELIINLLSTFFFQIYFALIHFFLYKYQIFVFKKKKKKANNVNNLIFISTSSQLNFVVLNRNNFLSTFFFFFFSILPWLKFCMLDKYRNDYG